ncbi:MAG: PBP1A family penicillin-binding protein [Acidobacteriota bacterium]|nr:MAG: PBP1A family penicillin-binding protein [Acidobacteriota bacterium]
MDHMWNLTRRGWLALAIVNAVALVAGIVTGVALTRDLPGIENLNENLTLSSLSRVTVLNDRHGQSLHSFAEHRRVLVTLDEISPHYVRALLATEDPRFYEHFGVDPRAVVRATWATVRTLDFGVEGASTLTMQLARQQFLSRRKALVRKIKEAILATHIERHYSKEEILTFYCNSIYLGHGRYGVEAAARFYFGKPAKDLTLPEAALLAGIAQVPEDLTPVRHPERALRRRNHVLARMVAEGVLPAEAARAASEEPIVLTERISSRERGLYFVEQVRRWLVAQYGQTAVYRDGLEVQTTIDQDMQRAAERAVAWGLDEYGRRYKQLPAGEPLPEDTTAADYVDAAWSEPARVDDVLPAVVIDVTAQRALVRVTGAELELGREQIEWTGVRAADKLLRPNTLVPIRVLEVDETGAVTRAELASEPNPEAALIAMDANTGDVLALVGGKDFRASEFNRAMQARRQAGSAFKPFVYAAAFEQGFLPTQRIYDAPFAVPALAGENPYQPENFERDYEGYVTLRHALEHSRNIPTVRLLDTLGYRPAIELARRLGIASALRPYPSAALGSFEVRLVDLVAAYGAFVNGGVLVEPQLVRSVRDAQRQSLWESNPTAKEVLSPEIAAQMASLLEGVVLRGTGRAARVLGRPVGGKTGTTDDYTDAWFIGFTPSMAVGVWVGHDLRETLGKRETGARAALPIWIRFLQEALAGQPIEEFIRPPGVRRTLIDQRTGLAARSEISCAPLALESVPLGRENLDRCSPREHLRARLPYPLQAFPIRSDGALVVPPAEVARWVSLAPEKLQVIGGGRGLRFRWNEKMSGAVALAWGAAEWSEYLSRLPLAMTEAQLRAEERDDVLDELRDQKAVDPEAPEPDEALPARLRTGVDGWPVEVLEPNRSRTVRPLTTPVDP